MSPVEVDVPALIPADPDRNIAALTLPVSLRIRLAMMWMWSWGSSVCRTMIK